MQVEIKRIQREVGITTIYVTHDQTEAMTMSDRIAVYNRGRIEQIGPPLEVYHRPQTRFVGEFLGVSNLLTGTVTDPTGGAIEVAGLGTIHAGRRDGLRAGQAVDLMVRAEDIAVVAPGETPAAANAFDMAIDGTINYGDSVLLLGRVGSHALRAKLPGSAVAAMTGRAGCRVAWRPDAVHVFPDPPARA